MSNQELLDQSRRKLLKGIAYGSALSVGGLSTVVFANSVTPKSGVDKETVTLFNQSDKTINLDASNPVSLEQINGWVVVNINKQAEQSTANAISLAPGQQHSFAVDAVLAPMLGVTGDYIVITSEFTALNNMIPISTVDVAIA